jgi:hypothetical protein
MVRPASAAASVHAEQRGYGGQVVGQVHVVAGLQAGSRERRPRHGEGPDRVDDRGRLLPPDLGRHHLGRAGYHRPAMAGPRGRFRQASGVAADQHRRYAPASQLGGDRTAAAAGTTQNPDFGAHRTAPFGSGRPSGDDMPCHQATS